MKRIWIPQAIITPFLLWALYPYNPYGYYTLLRWICCASFAFLAIQTIDIKKQAWVWIFGTAAIIYNPLIKIHLTRNIWVVINLITIVIAWYSAFVLKVKSD
jgi:hypothetical protein